MYTNVEEQCQAQLYTIHQKKSKIFQDSLSHRILRHMHEVLNIDKNKN